MIETIAELLENLLDRELPHLDGVQLKHAPTIGSMYEGLSQKLLNISMPQGLDLRVVTGFIHSGDVTDLSPQIDAMIVVGEGHKIPYTDTYAYDVHNVIAVIEVKKNLHSSELRDAIDHSILVKAIAMRGIQNSNDHEPLRHDSSMVRRTFIHLRGFLPSQTAQLSAADSTLYHTLLVESHTPARIIIGFHGFERESNLRSAYIDTLKSSTGNKGFGFGSLPQLIVSGNNALVKANGLPYYPKNLTDGKFGGVFSCNGHTGLLLLEQVWTRLDMWFNLSELWGEDFQTEVLSSLLSVRVNESTKPPSWEYFYSHAKEDDLLGSERAWWEPEFLTEHEFCIMQRLCSGQEIKLADEALSDWLGGEGLTIEDLTASLVTTGLVLVNDGTLHLATDSCDIAILPGGQYVAAENHSGRLSRWLAQRVRESPSSPLSPRN